MILPDYHDGSIVNLMSSIVKGLDGAPTPYAPLASLPPAIVAAADNVVLLVIDGLGYKYLCQYGDGFRRHLQGRMTSVFPTSTAPAITTFLTGLAPQQHGVSGWFMQLKELGTVAMVLPFCARWGGGSFAAAGVDARRLLALTPVFDTLAARCFFVIAQKLVDTPYSVAGAGRAERRGYRDLTDCFAVATDIIRQSRQRCYIYAYWPSFDALAHRHGVGSAAVRQHLQQLERGFESLLQALAGTNTLVIATADHGFIDTAPAFKISLSAHPELADCLAIPLCGEPRVSYCHVRPGRTERFERYVAEQLSGYCDCYPSAELVQENWFGSGEPNPRLLDRIGDYTLVTRDRYVIKDTLPTEKPWNDIGVHGGTSADEMYVPLIVARC